MASFHGGVKVIRRASVLAASAVGGASGQPHAGWGSSRRGWGAGRWRTCGGVGPTANSWHWNACAGDPYYALDCREDDYAWCGATPEGQLVPAIHFEQLRAGLYDYRHLLTLARLAKEKAGTPAAAAARQLIAARLAAFKLGQREHDKLFPSDDWQSFRRKLAGAIEALR